MLSKRNWNQTIYTAGLYLYKILECVKLTHNDWGKKIVVAWSEASGV